VKEWYKYRTHAELRETTVAPRLPLRYPLRPAILNYLDSPISLTLVDGDPIESEAAKEVFEEGRKNGIVSALSDVSGRHFASHRGGYAPILAFSPYRGLRIDLRRRQSG